MLVDYFGLRGRALNMDDIFSRDKGALYWYSNGYNIAALVALFAGIAPNIPGFLVATGALQHCPHIFTVIYDSAWFLGFCIAGLVYWTLSRTHLPSMRVPQV